MNNIVTIVLPVVAQPIRIPYADAGPTQSRNSQYNCIYEKNQTRIAAAYNHSMFMLLIT